MDGFGAMLAFEVAGGADAAQAVAERVRVIVHATSLGGVESLIERRARYESRPRPRRCCASASASSTSRTCGRTFGRARVLTNGLHEEGVRGAAAVQWDGCAGAATTSR